MRQAIIAAVISLALTQPATAQLPTSMDNEVDLELVLAVDISQSMDRDEQELQRAGYASAIVSEEVLEAIKIGPTGRIAVSFVEWGGATEQYVTVGWTLVDGPETASQFAAQVAKADIRHKQRTSIADALRFSAGLIATNQYQGLRRVIDISGDGPNNQGGKVTEARDEVLQQGIIINGLPLMMKAEKNTWQAMMNLGDYYEDCVIGGPGAFVVPVRSLSEFTDAIRAKLVLEIAGVQVPRVIRAAGRKPVTCSIYD